jgi:hypothetical protein
MSYLEGYRAARGTRRLQEELDEVLRLALDGARGLGEGWMGVVLADASAQRNFVARVEAPRRSWRMVQVHGAVMISRLRGVSIRGGESITDVVNRLVLERVYGPGLALDAWRGLECWTKTDPIDSQPVLHVLRRGEGRLYTRKLTAEDVAAAQVDPGHLVGLVELVMREGDLGADRVAQSASLVGLVDEDGFSAEAPGGGLFSAWMDGEDCYCVAYGAPGGGEPLTLTGLREGREGYLWARRVSEALSARWCEFHASQALHEAVESAFDVRPTLAMDPLDPMGVDDE